MNRTIRIPTNLVAGIVFILFGVALWFVIPWQIRMSTTLSQTVDARFIPKLIAGLSVLVGAFLIFKSRVLKREDTHEIVIDDEKRRLLFIPLLLGYVIAIDYFGFLLCSLVFSCLFLWFSAVRKWSHYAIVLTCTTGIYLVFRFLLNVGFTSMWGI